MYVCMYVCIYKYTIYYSSSGSVAEVPALDGGGKMGGGARLQVGGGEVLGSEPRYSIHLLYWYKITNTDAKGGGSCNRAATVLQQCWGVNLGTQVTCCTVVQKYLQEYKYRSKRRWELQQRCSSAAAAWRGLRRREEASVLASCNRSATVGAATALQQCCSSLARLEEAGGGVCAVNCFSSCSIVVLLVSSDIL